ncbi:MAG: hypothetical protein AB7O65_06325 [Candidatus Korobacteraceae bacterium]
MWVKLPLMTRALAVVLLLVSVGSTQDAFDTTFYLWCWNSEFKEYRSRSARSPLYVAPDGNSSVFASVNATTQKLEEREGCLNRSTLFLTTQAAPAQLIYERQGLPTGPQGNGIQIVDWSKDSTLLLADVFIWWDESDVFKHNLMLYNARTRRIRLVDLNELFSKHMGQHCEVDGRLRGFTAENDVVFEAWPIDEVYGASCVEKTQFWQVDADNWRVSPLPPAYKTTLNSKRIKW